MFWVSTKKPGSVFSELKLEAGNLVHGKPGDDLKHRGPEGCVFLVSVLIWF